MRSDHSGSAVSSRSWRDWSSGSRPVSRSHYESGHRSSALQELREPRRITRSNVITARRRDGRDVHLAAADGRGVHRLDHDVSYTSIYRDPVFHNTVRTTAASPTASAARALLFEVPSRQQQLQPIGCCPILPQSPQRYPLLPVLMSPQSIWHDRDVPPSDTHWSCRPWTEHHSLTAPLALLVEKHESHDRGKEKPEEEPNHSLGQHSVS